MDSHTSILRKFIQTIIDEPNDDATRLICADNLAENDFDARAEFIRVQVELAGFPDNGNPTRRQELEDREKALLDKHKADWVKAEIGEWIDPDRVTFARGFPETITMSYQQWAGHADELFASAPITSLKINNSGNQYLSDHITEFAASPHLARLTRLDLQGNGAIGDRGAAVLAASPNLTSLTRLGLSGNSIGDRGVTALAASPNMANLSELYLRQNSIGAEGAKALAASPNMANLTRLDLSVNRIGSTGLRALAQSPHMARLTELYLDNNKIDERGATALADSEYLTRLTKLSLNINHIRDSGITALANSPNMANLTELYLRENGISERGARALAASPHLGKLNELDVTENDIFTAVLEVGDGALKGMTWVDTALGTRTQQAGNNRTWVR